MAHMNRRHFLAAGAAAAGLAATSGCTTSPPQDLKSTNRFALATYSIWRFKDGLKKQMDECIDLAAEWGFDGLDLLHIQMDKTDLVFRKLLQPVFQIEKVC